MLDRNRFELIVIGTLADGYEAAIKARYALVLNKNEWGAARRPRPD